MKQSAFPSPAEGIPSDTRTILKTAAPIMIGLLLEQLIGMTDAIFLGRYGEVELGAAALGSVVFFLYISVAFGYGVGAQALMARANGARRTAEVGRIFRQSAGFLFALGSLLALASLPFAHRVMDAMIQSGEVARAAGDYVFWRLFGLPAAFLCVGMRAFYTGILRTRVLTWSSVVMVAANCTLNGLLIFGAGPIPALGISGAAIASAASEIAALLYLVLAAVRSGAAERYSLFRGLEWDGTLQRELFRLGAWLMVQEMIAFGTWLFFFAAVEHVSDRALAISNVVRQLGSLIFLFVHAFGTTCGSISSNLYGAKDFGSINGVVMRGLGLSYAAMIPIAAVFACIPETVLGWFTDIDAVILEARPAYYVMLASYLLTVAPFFLYFVIGALGFARPSFWITTASSAVYALYVAWITSVTTSVALIWTSDTVFGAGLGIGAWLVWRRAAWQTSIPAEKRLYPQGEA